LETGLVLLRLTAGLTLFAHGAQQRNLDEFPHDRRLVNRVNCQNLGTTLEQQGLRRSAEASRRGYHGLVSRNPGGEQLEIVCRTNANKSRPTLDQVGRFAEEGENSSVQRDYMPLCSKTNDSLLRLKSISVSVFVLALVVSVTMSS
jgi:hypothetical protein